MRGGLHKSEPRASLRVWGKCVWWQSDSQLASSSLLVDGVAWGACQKMQPRATNRPLLELKKTPLLAANFPTLTPLNKAIPIILCLPIWTLQAHDILPHLIYYCAFIFGPKSSKVELAYWNNAKYICHSIVNPILRESMLKDRINKWYWSILLYHILQLLRCRYSAQLLAKIHYSLHQGYQAQPNAP